MPCAPTPNNEPVFDYRPGTTERKRLADQLQQMSANPIEAPCVIDGRDMFTGSTFEVRAPHRRDMQLATVHAADTPTVTRAIDSAEAAKTAWAHTPWQDRATVFLRAAELLATRYRARINAATMLGQSKTVHQAEIDSACELIDFLRFNVAYYHRILQEQPWVSPSGVWNRMDYRPLEGPVLAITPFNFTAIAGNLPTAPALCGNTVVWKPSEKQALSAHHFMRILQEAGLPDGVINLVHGDGGSVSQQLLQYPNLGGLNFTGSSTVFRNLWEQMGRNIHQYRTYPRVVGETGGKNFIVAHHTADPEALTTALVRGAFEYQGQKCSAVSRAYLPQTLWEDIREDFLEVTASLQLGDVADFSTFLGAVIDESALRRHERWLNRAGRDTELHVLTGGKVEDETGWFVQPTVIQTDDPGHEIMTTELFGPIITVYIYSDEEWPSTLDLIDSTSSFGLTGAVFAQDQQAVHEAAQRLEHAAGNFYINDKPTGSIVAQQPFGGARASGTNDKAGSPLNLYRWISPRSIKENLDPPHEHTYPYMNAV